MRFFCTFCLLLGLTYTLAAQAQLAPKKTLEALRVNEKIKLDANFDEPAWHKAAAASDFLYSWPNPGRPASQKTEVRVIYDDHALYVAIKCYDSSPDSVAHRLTKRDEFENTDAASIVIDAYRDGQNALKFGVSPDNVQTDSKYSIANANPNNGDADGEDQGWDAVWSSAAKLTDFGWAAELEIPYSALRFPKKPIQEWGINFYRRINRRGESDSWNEIKAEISGSLNQMGILTGITNIKAPLRLSATPFVAAYSKQNYNQPGTSWDHPYSFGMDIKYGINEAFTLDATLIPDFGQVRSDQRVLNLSPFEVRFQENRPFFTEGTELFNKGGLFYSRRVGQTPFNYDKAYENLADNEEVIENPGNVLLLNASKISGRTKTGLGIGLFNAVEAPAFATVLNNEDGTTRQVQTASLTNKNIVVFDQNLKNNSSVTFINTNVTRSGRDLDANVAGALFNLKNKAQSYGLNGKVAVSNRFGENEREDGYTVNLEGSKLSGNFLYGFGYTLESPHYNPNDMGILFSPNENSGFAWVNYSRYKPWWKLNNFWSSMWFGQGRLFTPNVLTVNEMGCNFGGNTKSFHNFGFNGYAAPWGENDYFEAATDDFSRYYHIPASVRTNAWYNSDQRKKLVAFAFVNGRFFKESGRRRFSNEFGLRWRATNKFTIGTFVGGQYFTNDAGNVLFSGGLDPNSVGYESGMDNEITIGHRDVVGLNNSVEASFSFTNKMNIALFARHYWNKVEYSRFGLLNADGSVRPSDYQGISATGEPLNNLTVNFFNIDLVYTWRFAPGSDLLVVYKNNSSDFSGGYIADHNYFYNARHITDFSGANTFSFKVLYFIDYERLRR